MYVVKDTWTSKMSGKISNCKVPWSSARRSPWSLWAPLLSFTPHPRTLPPHGRSPESESDVILVHCLHPCSLHHFYHSFSQHFIPNSLFIWSWCLTTHVKKYNVISSSIRKGCSMIGKFHWGVYFLFREHSLMIGMKYTGLTSQFDWWNSY